MKAELCKIPGCINEGRYCRIHPAGSFKKPKPIAPRSKKMEEVMRKEYRPQVKEMIKEKTLCAVKSPVCTKIAQGFHHLQGREGKNLTGEKKIPCCNMCNQFIEKNDAWARANGFKLSKHANYKREK
jgi:predicted phosphoadenosine phosphosulfate sulfurtransferase